MIAYSNIYDGADRLVKTVVTRGTGSTQTSTVTTSYDALGRVSEIRYGNAATRQMTYDVHGWTDSIVTVINPGLTGTPVMPALETADGIAPFRDGPIATSPQRQVERLMYASGATPCYNGNISSRVFSDGRYDYTYDSYNRLTRADYRAPAGSNAQYTCTYGYDANSNIGSLSRSGVINIVGGVPVYNTHDYLYYFYDGNQLVSLGAGSAGVNYEGRTGLGSINDGDLTYDANGNLTSDGTRGIASVSYTELNQPERIDFDSREALVNSYDGRGFKHLSRLLDSSGKTVTVRRYIGDAIIEDGAVTMQRFAGGYFNANGVANYYMTDYQGNVTEVVNASGVVVQSVRYYPDGEPWMEPTGTNRCTFGGKERINLGGLNQYDFGPRLLNAAASVWGAPDRKAEKYYGISPYSYCAGNPVMFTDPTGCYLADSTRIKDWNRVKTRINERVKDINNQIESAKDDRKREELTKVRSVLHDIEENMSLIENSSQAYYLDKSGKAETSYDPERDYVVLSYDKLYIFVHEITHGGQIETGGIRIGSREALLLNDVFDERDAFRCQYAFDPRSVKSIESVREIKSIDDINQGWVEGITVGNSKPYGRGGAYKIFHLPVNVGSSEEEIRQAIYDRSFTPLRR